jgi:hypothetical protein
MLESLPMNLGMYIMLHKTISNNSTAAFHIVILTSLHAHIQVFFLLTILNSEIIEKGKQEIIFSQNFLLFINFLFSEQSSSAV